MLSKSSDTAIYFFDPVITLARPEDDDTLLPRSTSVALKLEKPVDIVLSPAYYWVKRADLPVKSLRDAKRLAPALFADQLSDGSYTYRVEKDENGFIAFAYDESSILRMLQSHGIAPAQIRRTYFAQHFFNKNTMPIAIDSTYALSVRDGIVLRLPAALAGPTEPMRLPQQRAAVPSVALSSLSRYGDTKQFRLLAGLLAAVIVLYGIQWGMVAQQNRAIESATAALFESYHLKPTMMQNKAILSTLEQTYAEQTKLRSVLRTFSTLPLQEKEKLQRIDLKKGSLKATFSPMTPERSKELKALLNAKKIPYKAAQKMEQLIIEVVL
jgi:hypothetical protein